MGTEDFVSGGWNRSFKDHVTKKRNTWLESDKPGLLLQSLFRSTNR